MVEEVTNKTFEEYVKEEIIQPFGLDHTYQNKPDDSLGVIPEGELYWNVTLDFEAP